MLYVPHGQHEDAVRCGHKGTQDKAAGAILFMIIVSKGKRGFGGSPRVN